MLGGAAMRHVLPSRLEAGLAACAVLSFLLHLALVPLLSAETAPAEQVMPPRPAASFRLVRSAAAPAALPAPAADQGAGAHAQLRPREAHIAEQEKPAQVAAAAEPQPAPENRGDGFDEGYLPRSALTLPPRPREVIMVPYPSFRGDVGHYAAEVSLFVDEQGHVQRVELAPGALPAPLETAVRQTFLISRFQPGEVDGRRVRSLMRIEVSFDSPIQAP